MHGFSLLEVLIALVIISIGLLGIAAMQALSINNTGSASSRSLAALEAASLSSAIGANPAYWEVTSGLPTSITVTGIPSTTSNAWQSTTLSDATLNGLTTDCTQNQCSATQMAAYDLKTWGNSLAVLLGAGSGAVTCRITPQPSSCNIEVIWYEKDMQQSKGSTAIASQQDYQLAINP